MDYIEQLRKQLGFLERSSQSFDAGYEDEAIRIAVVIRTLLHQTRSSTSLLTHLNAGHIKFFSTAQKLSPGTLFHSGSLSLLQTSSDGINLYVPAFDEMPFNHRQVSIVEWWEDPIVFVNNRPISRKDIVLGAANKDGGAHVDSNLTAEYQALVAGIWMAQQLSPTGEISLKPIPNSHLADLRQMAHELLNTSDLLALAK